MGRGWAEGMLVLALALLLAASTACRRTAATPFPQVAGPVAPESLSEVIAAQDRRLAELLFVKEDAAALRALLAEDVQVLHGRQGLLAAGPDAVVALVHMGHLARPETAAAPVTEGDEVISLARHGALRQGEQRLPERRTAAGPLGEPGRFFHVWRRSGRGWRLAQLYLG